MVSGSKQPTELLLVKGKKHLTKSEIEERINSEVKAPADNIQAPAYLTKELEEKFYNLANQLIDIGIMSNLDCEALARYITVEDQYQKITEKILKVKTVNDKYLALLQMQEKIFKMARSAAGDLGLTISSRCKLVVPKTKEEKPQNKFGKFAGGSSG